MHGGIYILNFNLERALISDNELSGVITQNGQQLKCEHLILSPSYLPESKVQYTENG